MGLPAAAAAVDFWRTSARTRRILASAVRVTALILQSAFLGRVNQHGQAICTACVSLAESKREVTGRLLRRWEESWEVSLGRDSPEEGTVATCTPGGKSGHCADESRSPVPA